MAEDRINLTEDGQELALEDFDEVAKQAGLADERVLAELLRLAPFAGAGTVAKAILPFGPGPYTLGAGDFQFNATVQGIVNGGVKVMPFRAVLGSRTVVAADPSPQTDPPSHPAKDNWRDQRSYVVALSDDGSTLGHFLALPSGVGNPRIDLVYVKIDVDVPTTPLPVRLVKPVPSGTAGPVSVALRIVQSATLLTVQGTPASSPIPPALPSDVENGDGTGSFYIPLAYVMVPTGFSPSSFLRPDQIQEIAPVVGIGPSASIGAITSSPMECVSTKPANGNADWSAWAANDRSHVPWMMPSTMQGGVIKYFGIDHTATTSIADAGIVDQSIDWRYRHFLWFAQVSGSLSGGGSAYQFAHQINVIASNGVVPDATVFPATSTPRAWGFGQSYVVDDSEVTALTTRGGAMVAWVNGTIIFNAGGQFAGNHVGLYVDMSNGRMHALLGFAGGWTGKIWFTLFATGQYSNP